MAATQFKICIAMTAMQKIKSKLCPERYEYLIAEGARDTMHHQDRLALWAAATLCFTVLS